MSPEDASSTLNSSLKNILHELHRNPFPEVQNPPETQKRASVALIIRIRPSSNHLRGENDTTGTEPTDSFTSQLDHFFARSWVEPGEPEVLFIRRASRQGDPWTGHIALPGGRRDPGDADDFSAAVRETWEEVGIDLTSDHTLAAGNLPQRLVTASWGRKVLMVLCPFIFLITEYSIPPLKLQPSEVASAFWVPLRVLLSKSHRRFKELRLSPQLAKMELNIPEAYSHGIPGALKCAGIHLVPSESHYSASLDSSNQFKKEGSEASLAVRAAEAQGPIVLWGLTFGVLMDLLERLPPYDALNLWTYPSFTSWHIQAALWIFTFVYHQRKRRALKSTSVPHFSHLQRTGQFRKGKGSDERFAETGDENGDENDMLRGESGMMNSDTVTPAQRSDGSMKQTASQEVEARLMDYYTPLRRAIFAHAVLRLMVMTLLPVCAGVWLLSIGLRWTIKC